MRGEIKIRRAVFSLSDKKGCEKLAAVISEAGGEILASGGTAEYLRKTGLTVTEVADLTGYGSMLSGRVKTLHPKIFGGILADRSVASHMTDIRENDIEPIDLVAVNFYPFEEYIKDNRDISDAIEMIDIGGPAMARAAAKNYAGVASVTSAAQYDDLIDEMKSSGGSISAETRKKLAVETFKTTAAYEVAIGGWLSAKETDKSELPEIASIQLVKSRELRYGENPHQKAALYRTPLGGELGIEVLQGKPLSYNNLLDMDSAVGILEDLPVGGAVVIKHLNPCGCGIGDTAEESIRRARETDPVSAFGGIIGIKGTCDGGAARAATENFLECIVALDYTGEALEIFKKKKNLRVGRYKETGGSDIEFRSIRRGILMQIRDSGGLELVDAKVVTDRAPTDKEFKALGFAWLCAKHVKSNAIVYGDSSGTLGIGAGQMSRVDSCRIAALKAKEAGHTLKGSVAASDAFFPFRDGVDVLAEEGATAVVQPGGSIRDEEVIRAANEHGMAMLFTGFRHFRH